MYKVKDAIYLFKKDDKLIIVDYAENKKYQVNHQDDLVGLLEYFRRERSFESIVEKFGLSRIELVEIVNQLLKLDILVETRPPARKLNIAIVGLGTTGSHIYRQLRNLRMGRVVLIDDDKVEEENVFRQAFVSEDIGDYKIDALAKYPGLIGDIRKYHRLINDEETLEMICEDNDVDLIIHAADFPSTRDMARIVEQVGNQLDIPYIINFGYVANVVSLPEFYYPNHVYCFSFQHQENGYDLLFYQMEEKVSYRIVESLSILVAQQVVDFSEGKIPVKYGERGYFHLTDFEWKTFSFIDRGDNGELLDSARTSIRGK